MEDRVYKQLASILIAAVIFGIMVYASYLPMRKAQIYISTLQSLQTNPPASLDDLQQRLSIPLDYPSPIGQEELVRNLANSVLGFVQQSTGATSTSQLISFMNSYYDPILARGKGMSFGQDLYLEGAINEIAFVQTNQKAYLDAAQQYYSEGHELGPDRPQPLYGLFDIYREESDVPDTISIADQIIKNWPTDQSIQQALNQFLASQPSSTTVGK
jgi:hypothetical protein